MNVPHCFRPQSEEDVIELVSQNPLAWVVASGLRAILLPVRPLFDEGSTLCGFRGHFPRPIAARFSVDRAALFLFTGVEAYVSPSWFSNRSWAPTWLSESGAFRCSVQLLDEPGELHASLTDLVEAMEDGRPNRWQLGETGERYAALAPQIVAYRADILDRRVAFRLGQNEDDQTFSELLAGLHRESRSDVAQKVLEARPWRKAGS